MQEILHHHFANPEFVGKLKKRIDNDYGAPYVQYNANNGFYITKLAAKYLTPEIFFAFCRINKKVITHLDNCDAQFINELAKPLNLLEFINLNWRDENSKTQLLTLVKVYQKNLEQEGRISEAKKINNLCLQLSAGDIYVSSANPRLQNLIIDFTDDKRLKFSKVDLSADDSEHKLLKTRIGHVLGLTGDEHESSLPSTAINYNASTFIQLQPQIKSSLRLQNIRALKPDFLDTCKENGDCLSAMCEWQNHNFTFHVVKEKDKTHLIYVNRGRSAFETDQSNNNPTTKVYTFTQEQQKEMLAISQDLHTALISSDRAVISKFINQPALMQYENHNLSNVMNKSHQKTGNCGFANLNFSWHLKLAGEIFRRSISRNYSYV